MIEIRTGQAPAPLSRQVFGERYRASFVDPAFAAEKDAIARLEEVAWQAYDEGRKAPLTRRAGPAYADPAYALSVEWLATRQAIDQAQLAWATTPPQSRACCSAIQKEVCNVARSVVAAVLALRAGHLSQPDQQIQSARPK